MDNLSTTPAKPDNKEKIDAAVIARERRLVPRVLLATLAVGVAVVCGGALSSPGYLAASALIWGLGFCVGGVLLGFVFGIPRPLPAGAVLATEVDKKAERDSADRTRNGDAPMPSEINSNLVEVSDWLTKIIIGVGLIELKHLPEAAREVAEYIAPSMSNDVAHATPVAGGIMLFFTIYGFLAGYLMTRIYLAVIIKWADNKVKSQNISVQLDSGQEIELGALSRLQQRTLDDVQQTLAGIVSTAPGGVSEEAANASREHNILHPKRVLWVDDRPENNTLQVEQLNRSGIAITLALSTDEALQQLDHETFNAVITDMHRYENGKNVDDAGVQLIRAAREKFPDLAILVYCSGRAAEQHGGAARAAGARFVTASATRLIAVLKNVLGT
ncbi:response regulator [Pseudoduganella lutea]|uniref:Response regulator n=1 Tax=Pseudoduganella lutea TaxID=321985 RepID=A0A4P6L555_9BURK|nr:response regulator [Pseudoduganella lutea]QBE66749.1 response regulator [Pseudoduganella lutea]